MPIPIPIACGAEIDMDVVEPTYPIPPFVIVSAWIVPPIETVAVNAADTGSPAPTIIPPTLLTTRAELSSS